MEFPLSRANIDKIRLGVDNNRLTALLCAILAHQGGSVTLTKEQAERLWEGASLEYESHKDGGITITLRAPSH